MRFTGYCPYPRMKDISRDDVTTKRELQYNNILYVLAGVITPLRISRIVNPAYKSGCFWKDKEKTSTLRGNEQQLKALAGLLKVILGNSNVILLDLPSFEYGRLAEGIVSGRQPLILVKSKLKKIILHK